MQLWEVIGKEPVEDGNGVLVQPFQHREVMFQELSFQQLHRLSNNKISQCAYLDNLQGGDMQVAICFKNGDMFVLQTEQKTFSVGQKIVIERGDMFEIEDVQYQFRKTDSGLVHICTNLIIKEEA